jgi:AcrR family transcriptional regulator
MSSTAGSRDTDGVARTHGNPYMVTVNINIDTVPAGSLSEVFMKRKPSASSRAYHHGNLRLALVEAALTLVSEKQDWTFSLREVARRAGVSHNAPYNHFADKRDLLAAVAAAGFDSLRERLLAASLATDNLKTALIKTAVAYVSFGVENPARYRLMFGSVLPSPKGSEPSAFATSAASAKAVLEDIILRGAQVGDLAVSSRKKEQLPIAVLAAWSTVHGLTMVAIDRLAEAPSSDASYLADKVARLICNGLVRK